MVLEEDMQRDVKAGFDGAIGGAAGTILMSLVMLGAKKAGIMGQLPPERITEAALEATGEAQASKETVDALTVIAHFGYGIGAGTLFGIAVRRLRPSLDLGLLGVIYGTLIWFVSYKGWVPALGIMPPPERDRPYRPESMLVAHWVYGWTLGKVLAQRSSHARRWLRG
jgi:uncharacterized membrane protein YagU involved in acid resistance